MNTYIIGTLNTTTQDLVVGDTVDLGSVYRRFVNRGKCGLTTYDFTSNAISLQHSGFYHITATIQFTAPVAGDVTFSLAENGVAITGASVTETITTATTEIRSAVIDFYVVVSKGYVSCMPTTLIKNISYNKQ